MRLCGIWIIDELESNTKALEKIMEVAFTVSSLVKYSKKTRIFNYAGKNQLNYKQLDSVDSNAIILGLLQKQLEKLTPWCKDE